MTTGEPYEIMAELALVGQRHIPISDGLRAAADDSGDPRMAKTLREIAIAIDRGVPIDQALANSTTGSSLLTHRLICESLKTANVGWAVTEIGEHRRRNSEIWRSIFSALAYPTFIFGLALGVYAFVLLWIVPGFKQTFLDFELKLPSPTEVVVWWSDVGIWLVLKGLLVMTGLAVALWFLLPRSLFRFLLTTIPLFGSLWRWSGVADWSRWMYVLLSERVPLVEALQLAASGSSDASVCQASSRVASRIESGVSLADALWAEPRIPPSVIPFVISGIRNGTLPEVFREIAELLEERVLRRAKLICQVIPPLILFIVGSAVVAIIPALFMPLVSLVVGLSR